jgi:hypothetical protein
MWGKNANDYFIFFHFFGCCVDVFIKKNFGVPFIFQSFAMLVKFLNFFFHFFFWCNPMVFLLATKKKN